MVDEPKLSEANRALQRLIALETFSTPREFMASATPLLQSGSAEFCDALGRSRSMQALQTALVFSDLKCESETRYARLYSTPGTARKRLLVAFTGVAMRLMMPLPIFMQALPRDVDLLILYDPLRDHYRKGIWDGTKTLFDLKEATAPVARAYGDVIALGVSGGGLPALRFAKHVMLRRAASFGGRYIDDTLRNLRKESVVTAYDPLCACDTASKTEALLVYASENTHDARAAKCAAAAANAFLLPLNGQKDHIVLWTIQLMGHLPDLLEMLFSSSAQTIREALDAWIAANPLPRQSNVLFQKL